MPGEPLQSQPRLTPEQLCEAPALQSPSQVGLLHLLAEGRPEPRHQGSRAPAKTHLKPGLLQRKGSAHRFSVTKHPDGFTQGDSARATLQLHKRA